VLADRSPEYLPPTDRQVQRDGGLVYRFKNRRALSNLRIHEISYGALQYSLVTPPSTFRR
jgi:hypothetical protein